MPEQPQSNADTQEIIIEQIKKCIQIPKNLLKIEAINVYDNRWRVNMWCQTLPNHDTLVETYRITHSWFIVCKPNGDINSSYPPLDMTELKTGEPVRELSLTLSI